MSTEHVYLRLTLPDSGEILRWSRDGPTKAAAHYDARVLSFGAVRFDRSDVDGNVQSPSMRVRIHDVSKDFAARVARRERLKGARAEVVEFFSETVRYSGEVSGFDPDGELGWTIALRPRDARLSGKVQSTKFNLQSFPNMDQATTLDVVAPWLCGLFDRGGIPGTSGALPTYLVDRLGFRYAVCVGWVSVLRSFRGVALLNPTAYVVEYVTVDAIRYTLLKFSTSQGAAVITVDVAGYSDDYDAQPGQPGTPVIPFLNDSGACVNYALCNLLMVDNSNARWVTTHADVDTAAFATFDDEVAPLVPYKVSIRVASEVSGYDVLRDWVKATGGWVSWNAAGQVTVARGFTPATADFVDSPFMREDHGEVLSLQRQFSPREKVRRLSAKYGVFPADEKSGLTVSGDTGAPEGQKDVSSPFAPAFV